ncbi:hypothetical protein Tco_0482487, partial [Tanacetum coccineum]
KSAQYFPIHQRLDVVDLAMAMNIATAQPMHMDLAMVEKMFIHISFGSAYFPG